MVKSESELYKKRFLILTFFEPGRREPTFETIAREKALVSFDCYINSFVALKLFTI